MLKFFLPSLLLCLLITLCGAADGVYIYKPNASRSNSSAQAGTYKSTSKRGATTTIVPSSGSSFQVTKFQPLVLLPHVDPYKYGVIRVNNLEGFKATYNKYAAAYNKYSKSRPLLQSQMDSMKDVVTRLKRGEGYYKGSWMPDSAIDRAIALEKQTETNRKRSKALAYVEVMTLKNDKVFKEVMVTKKLYDKVLFNHVNGAASAKFDQLPISLREELGEFEVEVESREGADLVKGAGKDGSKIVSGPEVDPSELAKKHASLQEAIHNDYQGRWGTVTEADLAAISELKKEKARQADNQKRLESERDAQIKAAKEVLSSRSEEYAIAEKNAGTYVQLDVRRKLDKEDFPVVFGNRERLYEVEWKGQLAILIAGATEFESSGVAMMFVNKSGETKVKMNDGFTKSVQILREVDKAIVDRYWAVASVINDAKSLIKKIKKEREVESQLADLMAYTETQLKQSVCLPRVYVSKDLRARGFEGRVILTRHKELLQHMRRGETMEALSVIDQSRRFGGGKRGSSITRRRDVDGILRSLRNNKEWRFNVTLRSPRFKFSSKVKNDKSVYRPPSAHGAAYHGVAFIQLQPQLAQVSKYGRTRVSLDGVETGTLSAKHPDEDGFICEVGTAVGEVCFYEDPRFVSRRVSDTRMERVTAPSTIWSEYLRKVKGEVEKLNKRITLGELDEQGVQSKMLKIDSDIRRRAIKEFMRLY